MDLEKNANSIVQTLCESGWEAYIVGGAARDLISGKQPEDFDVVTQAPYEVIRALFKHRKTALVGESFKVCLIDGIEVATYRRESGENGRIGVAQTIQEDLARRDFTINAMAYCPYNGGIVDDYGGVEDLKAGIIRFTGGPSDRIHEDPCRIIRACRFLAKLEGRFAPETLEALKTYRKLVPLKVAPERIRLEIIKSLKYPKPSIFFDALFKIGLLKDIFPGLDACYGHDGGHFHHETIDLHSKLVGDRLPSRKPLFRLAGYLHDIGKPQVAKMIQGNLTFIGHERIGAEMAEHTLTQLKFSHSQVDYVTHLIRHHMRNLTSQDAPKTVRKLLRKLHDDGVDWREWLYLKIIDKQSNLKKPNITPAEIRSVVMAIRRELRPTETKRAFTINDLVLDGHMVMQTMELEPGPRIGELLNMLLDKVIENPELNQQGRLIQILNDHKVNKDQAQAHSRPIKKGGPQI